MAAASSPVPPTAASRDCASPLTMPRVAVMVAMEEEALYLRPLIAGEDGGTTEVRPSGVVLPWQFVD